MTFAVSSHERLSGAVLLDSLVPSKTRDSKASLDKTLRIAYVETSGSSLRRHLDAVVLSRTVGEVLTGTSEERDTILAQGPIKLFKLRRGAYHQVIVYPDVGSEVDRRMLETELNHITVDAASMIVVTDELGHRLQGSFSSKSPPLGIVGTWNICSYGLTDAEHWTIGSNILMLFT